MSGADWMDPRWTGTGGNGGGGDGPPPERASDEQYDRWRASADGEAVYKNCAWRAQRLRQRGWRHFGMRALLEAARFDRALDVGPDAAGFKINNNHCSRLARELMDREPGLADFFELRELRS